MEVIFEGKDPVEVNTFGYLNINPKNYYELRNNSDKDVIISFTRFDAAP